MSGVLSPVFGAGAQLFTNQGVVLSGGLLWSYLAGTTTLQPTWTSSTQVTQNSNPIVLDSAGRPPQEIWQDNNVGYKFVLQDSAGGVLGTWDNIPGINSSTTVLSEWVVGISATYVNATTFTVPGNNIGLYQVNRRVQYAGTTGTYYGTITSSVYDGSTLTTVQILADSVGLDAGLGVVNYGFMSATNFSVPKVYAVVDSPTFTGVPAAPTAAGGTNTGQIATTAFVQSALVPYALKASPALTGVPTAPTAAPGVNTTQLATTAYVVAAAFSAVLPSQTSNGGKFVTTDGTTASWAYVNPQWVTKTANYTLVAGDAIMANTVGGTFTLTLPAGPAANTQVKIADYGGSFSVNNLTVAGNGSKIMGLAEDLTLNLNNASLTFSYIDATQGWRIV